MSRMRPLVDDVMEIDFKELERLSDRKEFLCAHPPPCFRCDTEQVQMRRIDYPAVWRCRKCKFEFEYEPERQPAEPK